MSRSTWVYAAVLLTPLAASLSVLHLCQAPADGAVAVVMPAPPAPVAELVALEDCDDAPAAPAAVPAPVVEPVVEPGAAVLLHERHFVFATLPDMTLAKGQPKIHRLADGFTADYALAQEVVPGDIQRLAGARFTVFAGDGSACQADAGPSAIHGQMDGVFAFAEAAPTRAELREAAAAMEPEAHVVQSALRGPRACDGVWARRADLPAPVVFGRREASADERAQVRGQLAGQPAVVALRAERAEYFADMPAEGAAEGEADWSAFLDDTLELAAWEEVGGSRRYVTAQVGSPAEGCDGFGERAAVVFLREGDALVAQPGPGFLDPLALMDIDRDGRLEAVVDQGRTLASVDEESPLSRGYAFPELGCGC